MKIKSAVLHEMGLPAPYKKSQPLKIEELELKEPDRGEVLIEIKAAGLCHSDLSVINGNRPRPVPMALGHEAAGIVVETGEGVRNFTKGDHVVCVFIPSCGECLPCAEGRPALCEEGAKANTDGKLLSGGQKLHRQNESVYHHLGVSAFSNYIVADQHSLVKVDTSVPFEIMALFGCAVLTGVGAVVNTAKLNMGSSVAIVGLGGVGLSALLGAVAAGAREIIAIDLNEDKLKFAKELGATAVFNSSESFVEEAIRNYSNGGLEYVFETAGAVPALELAYKITRRGGETITTGLPHPEHKIALPQVTLAAEERTIKGSYVGSCVPARDIPRFVSLYKQGRLPIDKLLSDTISLEEINEGFDRLHAGEVNRLVVKM
ncbi:zinc-dependent alcohol dehydrogenase family protein [Virgibacillus sp. W0430]|uniref:zinc-dependent alcohol dehydrogenase family protein n=1 Tax=Virgibacillus sp. W0430 TaxID=3391580 RepID=UPI003F477F13